MSGQPAAPTTASQRAARGGPTSSRRQHRSAPYHAAAALAFLCLAPEVESTCAFAFVAAPDRSPSRAFSSRPRWGGASGAGAADDRHRSQRFAYTDGSDRTPIRPLDLRRTDAPNGTPKLGKPVEVLPNGGRVTLVGSGPGDPDLLTLSAYRVLSDPSNYIISDRLVSDEILELIRGECVVARKRPGCAEEAQEEIYRWVEEGLARGRHVVRLKIGDPFVFGRGGEEVLRFREFGVEPRVIPGVSSAFSAPLLGSIPVTHRGVANQVVMCTGYGQNYTSPDLIRYHKEQTVVFLMAVGRLRQLCQRLVDTAGYPPGTPVAIVERAGCPNQRTVVGNLDTIADIAEENNVRPPSTIVVGEVVNVLLERDDETGAAVAGLVQNATVGLELV